MVYSAPQLVKLMIKTIKHITLAIALLVIGYPSTTHAIPSLNVEFSQGGTGNWYYALDIEPEDLPLGTPWALQINNHLFGAGMVNYNGGPILIAGGVIDLQNPLTTLGLHTTRLYYEDMDTYVEGETYTIVQPTGIRPGTPVPDSSTTLVTASLGFIVLCALRRTVRTRQEHTLPGSCSSL
jgi:hypothetical protein